jgi:hypothetical protein
MVVTIAGLAFALCSLCAIGNAGDRATFAAFALVDAGVIAAGVWAIGRLNRKP